MTLPPKMIQLPAHLFSFIKQPIQPNRQTIPTTLFQNGRNFCEPKCSWLFLAEEAKQGVKRIRVLIMKASARAQINYFGLKLKCKS